MSKIVWKKLGSLKLKASPVTLKENDGHLSAPVALFQDILVELIDKTMLIDIEIMDA